MFTDIHHHISYDMYLSSHTRGIPKKSGPSDQFRTYSGPLSALRSRSGPSPEFRTLLVPLVYWTQGFSLPRSNLWDWSRPSFIVAFMGYIGSTLQDPKSSLWLWKKHERKKQKKRTVNYQHYLEMLRTDGNFLSTSGGDEDDSGFGHMTKKYMAQIENFLTYGQRNLDRRQIEKLKKENERKERVGRRKLSKSKNVFPRYCRR